MKKTTQTKASRTGSRAAKSQTELTAAYDNFVRASLSVSQLEQMAADNAKQLASLPGSRAASQPACPVSIIGKVSTQYEGFPQWEIETDGSRYYMTKTEIAQMAGPEWQLIEKNGDVLEFVASQPAKIVAP